MDDHNICWEYSVYGSIAQNLKFSAWVMCGTVVILQIIYNEGENTGSVYCFQFYNKGILLKFQSSFSSSVVEIFRPLTPPTSCFITNIYHFIHRFSTRFVGCCGCCHPAKRLGNAYPQAAWGIQLGCSQGPATG